MKVTERTRGWTTTLLLLIAFTVGFCSILRDYGVTWDEALGDLFFGQRYLSYFTSFDAKYLDFAHDPYPANHQPDLTRSPFRAYPWEYYPVANTLAAATSYVASNLLHLVDPFDGFHLLNLILGALLLVLMQRTLQREVSSLASAAAALALFLLPRVVNEAMSNIKDFPEMVLFSATLLTFHHALQRRSRALLLFSGVVWGLALGTKANALFVPLIALPYAWLQLRRDARRGEHFATIFVAAVIATGVWIASWPYLWDDPLRRLLSNLFYIASRKSISSADVTSSPLLMLLWSTPPVVLLLMMVGVFALIRRRREALPQLLLLWIAVVLARTMMPGAVNFDVVRHFLELFPPLAMGVAYALELPLFSRRLVRPLAVAVLALTLAITNVRVHPYQIAYWNALVGGTRGAAERRVPQFGDYWAVTYRHDMNWLNANAERAALVIAPIAQQCINVPATARLRVDLRTADYATPEHGTRDPRRLAAAVAIARRAPVYVVFINRPDWGNETTEYCERTLRPVAEWSLDGVWLSRIYRLR